MPCHYPGTNQQRHIAAGQRSAVALIGQPCPLSGSFADAFLPPVGRSSCYALPLIQEHTNKGTLQAVSGGRCPDRSALQMLFCFFDAAGGAFLPLSGGQGAMPCHLSRETPPQRHIADGHGVALPPLFLSLQMLFCPFPGSLPPCSCPCRCFSAGLRVAMCGNCQPFPCLT